LVDEDLRPVSLADQEKKNRLVGKTAEQNAALMIPGQSGRRTINMAVSPTPAEVGDSILFIARNRLNLRITNLGVTNGGHTYFYRKWISITLETFVHV
jgi:hypothetical protein